MKIYSQNVWLVDEEVSVLGTNNPRNLRTFMRIYHKNFVSKQNSINHKNFRPRKFETV